MPRTLFCSNGSHNFVFYEIILKNKLWLLFLNDSKDENLTDITGGGGMKEVLQNKNKQNSKLWFKKNYGSSRTSEANC